MAETSMSRTNQSKIRRRRRQDKAALNARLVLDEHVKGDVGIVSVDLYHELFPGAHQEHHDANGHAPPTPDHHFLAISPKTPFSAVDDISWTVVPVRPSSALASATVQFSPSSLALQGFAEELQRTAPSKLLHHSRSGIEIVVLDVQPLPLTTVFVTLEDELVKRLENGEGVFHSDRSWAKNKALSRSVAFVSDRLGAAIREALSVLKVIHNGDLFALPLPPHSITHMPPSPARVTLCEPVAQGILLPNTRIIVTRVGHSTRSSKKARALPLRRVLNELAEVEEDTSDEQFYSSVEDKYKTDGQSDPEEIEDDEETDNSDENEDEDDLSDDSMDDMISLQAPMLSATAQSGATTMQPGTPHTLNLGRMTGINTPGSVYSSFTTTTAKAGGQRGRLFKAQCLVQPLPEQLLNPTPVADDDEENRVYVETSSLTKIGCFSGDWVRLETAEEPAANGLGGLWSLGNFGELEDDVRWRPVKVYSLPEGYATRPVAKVPTGRQDGRRASFFDSHVARPSSSSVYLSPILSANLDNPPFLRLSALKRTVQYGRAPQARLTATSRPPQAREISLSEIKSPLSSERVLEKTYIARLRQHFSLKSRILMNGDLIALPIDEVLGRTIGSSGDELADEGMASVEHTKISGVVWFKVGHVVAARNDDPAAVEEEVWGGAACVDVPATVIRATTREKGRLPGTLNNPWEYYLGLRQAGPSASHTTHIATSELKPPMVTGLHRRLRELVAAATSPRAIHFNLQPLAVLLVSTQRNTGKATVVDRSCHDIGLHTYTLDAYDILKEGGDGADKDSVATLNARAERAMGCGPEHCALLVRHIEALSAARMAAALKDILAGARVLIATTTEVDKLPDGIRSLFTHEIEMFAPDENEREGILQSIIDDRGTSLAADVDLGSVAVKTAALVAGDLVDVVDRALVARRARIECLAETVTDGITTHVRDVQICGGPSGKCLNKADFDIAVEAARKNFADSIGAPKIPNVSWDDVGGLSNVKDAVMETIQLPLERPELFAKGMKKRSGILFYGPPGTGKTLLAKAIATEFSLNFFSVKGPELLNMYIGESEANVRRVFQRARDARPCVVFFDELDSVAPKRGNQGDSGGVMDRIVSQLLAELDGMSDGEDGGGGVFVIGATNRPDLLDAALLRPGRFDKMLYLGVSDTHEKQATILEALTRKFTMSPTISLQHVAAQLPFTYTGADFYALCSDAMLKAVTRQASAIDSKIATKNAQLQPGELPLTPAYYFDHYATKEDIAVMVTEEDFLAANRELIPSVSAKELEHYKKVREQFENTEEKQVDVADGDGHAAVNGSEATPSSQGLPGWQMAAAAVPKTKTNGKARSKGKGKGKATAEDSDDDEGNDERGFSHRKASNGNHGFSGNGFQEGTVEDEEDLY